MSQFALPRAPMTDRICGVCLDGTVFIVAVDYTPADPTETPPLKAEVWAESIRIEGTWYEARAILSGPFWEALNARLNGESE